MHNYKLLQFHSPSGEGFVSLKIFLKFPKDTRKNCVILEGEGIEG